MTKQTTSSGQWHFWIDRGGTFTDLVARRPDGNLITRKLLSECPDQYEDAALHGIRSILDLPEDAPLPPEAVASLRMGTTVATNALLERRGEPTVLLMTQGFGDMLRIGYQNRPKIFARHIVLPSLLYSQVIEVAERIDAHGRVLVPLDEEQARRELQAAYDQGFRAVAIVLMHGYRFHAHEERLERLAWALGFTQVSVSHKVSPLIRLVARGETTVVDAYLSPVLDRYIKMLGEGLGPGLAHGVEALSPQLLFMRSCGGLTSASRFRGKDAVLSGPAGGVIGMVRTAAMSGLHRLIGFDMGGTSTDVTHYNGTLERGEETVIGGVRLRTPMLSIHTVAAGGGSILHFDGSRYRVGPDSAGADPGPACYGRGGPLTVTDCNVLLGRIQPQYFPALFGPHGNEPLHTACVQEQFALLARRIQQTSQRIDEATGQLLPTPEQVAEGFLRIAVENMVNAIRTISVQRGHDVSDYTLQCFGGASGQHACLVADALGMGRIFFHPLAGVLSAYGMGLAEVRALREAQVELSLDHAELEETLRMVMAPLTEAVTTELQRQGFAEEQITLSCSAILRRSGTDAGLSVPFGSVKEMRYHFAQAHQQRFGFAPGEGELILSSLSVEAISQEEQIVEPELPLVENETPPYLQRILLRSGSVWQEAPLYQRDDLLPGHRIMGPALLVEAIGTVVIEAGWQAEVNSRKHLILTRFRPRAEAEAIDTTVNPVMLEVFANLFMAIAEQMGVTLAKTAHSVNIKERLDFSCALFDREGNLVANAPHVPVHLGSMGEAVRVVLADNRGWIRPGDVFMQNNPYKGGTHLPDVTVITPVWDDDGREILFFVASRGHHADIGGRTPGSAPPDSRHIEEEGMIIDNWLLVDRGRFKEEATRELLLSSPWPCRNVAQNLADLAAQVAANETGARELRRMVSQFGLDIVQAYMRHIQDNAEEAMRRVLSRLPDGAFSLFMDDGSRIQVRIRIDRQQRKALIDFTGSSGQHTGNRNAPQAVCRAVVLYVFRTLINEDIPLNEGCLKPLQLRIPEGSMLSPCYPAAVIAGNTEVSQAIADCLFGALGILAASQGTMNNFLYGNAAYQNYETICGGTGAGPDHPGTDAVHSHMTNTRMTDPEVLEWRFPVQLTSFSLRRGSGGAGRFPGGNGVIRRLRFLESMTATILSSRRVVAPYGLVGGNPGLPGRNILLRRDGQTRVLQGDDEVAVEPGDTIIMETPGGGGYGPPEEEQEQR